MVHGEFTLHSRQGGADDTVQVQPGTKASDGAYRILFSERHTDKDNFIKGAANRGDDIFHGIRFLVGGDESEHQLWDSSASIRFGAEHIRQDEDVL